MVPELVIAKDVERDEQVHKLAMGVHNTCIELAKV